MTSDENSAARTLRIFQKIIEEHGDELTHAIRSKNFYTNFGEYLRDNSEIQEVLDSSITVVRNKISHSADVDSRELSRKILEHFVEYERAQLLISEKYSIRKYTEDKIQKNDSQYNLKSRLRYAVASKLMATRLIWAKHLLNKVDGCPSKEQNAPPKSAEFLLHLILPKSLRETLLGDLEEEFRGVILPKFGHQRARWWYWAQVTRSILPLILGAVTKLADWCIEKLKYLKSG